MINPVIKKALLLFALVLSVAAANFAQISKLQFPQSSGYVNDFANKLNPQTRQSLENLLTNFRNRANIEITVVTIPFEQMNDYPIEDYTLELGRRWGVGKASNEPAAVLLVAIKEKGSDGMYHGGTRLEISRHLEGDVPDGLAGELIRRMRVDFQKGNFDGALNTGVQTILATIAEKRGISMEGIDTNAVYRPRTRRPSTGISPSTIIFMIIVFFVVMAILSRFGRGGGGGGGYRRRGSDWWVGPVIWSGGGSGWGGSGSSSDSGGGWGGFGGGGDFGGGGASDSW
ncbi:MAG: TPM domain-containing protein [Acidobacteriota bacterium]